MRLTVPNPDRLPPDVREALEIILSRINTIFAKEHNGDGTHKAITAPSITLTGAVTAASVAASGAITAATVTTTGAITAGTSLTATTSVNGATLSMSGAAATGNLTVTGTFSATSTVAWGGGGTISSSANVPKLDASNTFTGAVQTISHASAEWRATTGTVTTTVQPSFIGTTTAHDLTLLCNNATVAKLFSGGGMTIGAPTGGNQGAGTLNVDVNAFLDGSAYANP